MKTLICKCLLRGMSRKVREKSIPISVSDPSDLDRNSDGDIVCTAILTIGLDGEVTALRIEPLHDNPNVRVTLQPNEPSEPAQIIAPFACGNLVAVVSDQVHPVH